MCQLIRRNPLLIPWMRCLSTSMSSEYVQGQYNKSDPKIREYFYYVDHNGMLFLDDARMKNFTSCFKEKKFLKFFFSRIKRTQKDLRLRSSLYQQFPFTSYCGRERNYIRVSATPFVFSSFVDANTFELNYTGMTRPFKPESLYEASDGRLYHEFDHEDCSFALVRSQVADSIFTSFVWNDDGGKPVGFRHGGSDGDEVIKLNYKIQEVVERVLSNGSET